MANGLSIIKGSQVAAYRSDGAATAATKMRISTGKKQATEVTAEDAFNKTVTSSAKKTRDAFAAADARLTSDIAAAKAKGDKAAAAELTAKQAGLRAYAASANASTQSTNASTQSTASSVKAALQGAFSRAAQNTQDVLARADAALTSQIKVAQELGDADTIADLTAKRDQVSAVVAQIRKNVASQSAAFAELVKAVSR